MAKVLNSFLYSSDGYTVEVMKVGEDRDFGSATHGLVDRGVIEGVATVTVETAEDETAPAGGKKKK